MLLGVINDILDYQQDRGRQAGAGAGRVRPRPGARRRGVGVAEKAASKGLKLGIELASDVPLQLLGDPLRLEQVLINLADNAVKFTSRGEIGISVSLQERRAEQVALRFEVRDTGIGLSPEQQAQPVPELPAGRQLDHAPLRRHRPRTGDLPSGWSS